ncbi:MAG: phytanoyl-CoA dioxygenase family protein [Armatimonadota bacterium]|nr:phytanoyl-CoA dioxygenase family protein [Armatimonadota bacterium]
MTQSAAGPLSPDQIHFFDQQGYLVVEDLFSNADLQPVIEAITQEIDTRARDLVDAGELSRTYEEEPFETRLARISAETDKIARAIWNGSLALPAFFNLIRNPRLLDVAEQFCGPELIASSVYRLRPKVPNHNMGPVPWHQDSGYFEPYCDKALVLTVWLPLVDATEERGCLWVVPGVQGGAVLPHGNAAGHPYLEIPDSSLPAVNAVCVPVKKGGALLLSNRTPHASFENKTDIVRWSMDLRYQSAGLPTNAVITPLAGEVRHSVEEAIPPACYPPEADFLVRSRARPHEVVQDAETFRRLRETHLSQPVTARWG